MIGTPKTGINGALGVSLAVHIGFNNSDYNDASGNGVIVTAYNNPSFTTDKFSIPNGALSLKASLSQYLSYNIGYSDDSSFNIFFYHDGTTTNRVLAYATDASGSSWSDALLVKNNKIRFYINGGIDLTSTVTIAAGWHTVCVTVDLDGNTVIYIDGAARGSVSNSGNRWKNHSVMYIGKAGLKSLSDATTYANFNNKIDECRYYHRCLTAAEVLELHDMNVNYDTGNLQFPIKNQCIGIDESEFYLKSTYSNYSSYVWDINDGGIPNIIPDQRAIPFPFMESVIDMIETDFYNVTSYPSSYAESTLWFLSDGTIPYLKNYTDGIAFPVIQGVDKSEEDFYHISSYTGMYDNPLWSQDDGIVPYLIDMWATTPFPDKDETYNGKDGVSIADGELYKKETYISGAIPALSPFFIDEGFTTPYIHSAGFMLSDDYLSDGISITSDDMIKKVTYSNAGIINWDTTPFTIINNNTTPYISDEFNISTEFPNMDDYDVGKDGFGVDIVVACLEGTYGNYDFDYTWVIDETLSTPYLPNHYLGVASMPNNDIRDGISVTDDEIALSSTYPALDFDLNWIMYDGTPYTPFINQPIINYDSGSYKSGRVIEIVGDGAGVIMFTTDESDPTDPDNDSALEYIEPFYVIKDTVLKVAQIYSYGNSNIETREYNILNAIDLPKPFFNFKYQTFNDITAYDDVCDTKFVLYEPNFKVIDKMSDLSVVLEMKAVNKKILSIPTNHFCNTDKDIIFINDIPLDFYENETTIHEENDFIYLVGGIIDEIGIDNITSVKILQSEGFIEKEVGIFNYGITTNTKYSLRVKEDGNIIQPSVNYNGKVLHIIIKTGIYVTNDEARIIDDTLLFSNYGLGIKNGKLSTDISVNKLNQNSISTSGSCDTYLIPYIYDSENKSYYERFVARFKSNIYNGVNTDADIKRDAFDKYISDLKDKTDFMRMDNYNDKLNEVYKHDLGVYEKMLIENYKTHYEFKKDNFELVYDVKAPWDNNISLLQTVLPKIKVIVDNSERLPLEVYVNNRIIPNETMRVDLYGNSFLYVNISDVFPNFLEDMYEFIKPSIDYRSFYIKYIGREYLLIKENESAIKDFITISVLKKRSDYNVFRTGFVDWNKNIAEIPDVFNDYYGASVFVDGFLVDEKDYYVEYIGGVLCLIFNRVFTKKKTDVVITFYDDPICIDDIYLDYTSGTFTNTLTCLDEVYLNGQLVSNSDIYTVDSYRNILLVKSDGENDEQVIRVRRYVDKTLYDSSIGKDYRSQLIDKINLINYIESTCSVKRSLNSINRNHSKKSIEEYIFYFKYVLNAGFEQKDVFISPYDTSDIEGFTPLTEKEMELLHRKYSSLFDADGNIIYECMGDDNDYPTDIIFGGTLSVNQYTTYLETKGYIDNEYIPDGALYDSNYRGEKLKE